MLRRFQNSERANIAPTFALTLVPLVLVVSSAVDLSSISTKASKLQESLDATALAIGTEYYSGMSEGELYSLGQKFFLANNEYSQNETVLYDSDAQPEFSATATPTGEYDIISVTSRVDHDPVFGGNIFWGANRRAFVKVNPGMPACILALNKHASDAVKIQGSTNVDLKKCVIASNSDAADSIYRGGSAQLKAECVSAVGYVTGVSSTSLECGMPRENQYPTKDPLADVVPPGYGSCENVSGGKTKTLSPGTYCNKNLSGNVTLEPGTYVFKGGDIKLGGNGSLTGHGVTIFLMDGAQFTSAANEVIDLSPPTSGDYQGITIYQSKGNTNDLRLNGGTGTKLTGYVYAPDAHVFYAGNSVMSGDGDCVRVVGDTVEMTGASAIANDCTGVLGNRQMYAGKQVTLVK